MSKLAVVADTAVPDPGTEKEQDRYIVPGLARGLAILRSFSAQRPELGIGELAREHDLPRSTVFRLTYTLEQMGCLQRCPNSKRYRLAPGVLTLGFDYFESLDLLDIAKPVLAGLRDRTSLTAQMGILDNINMIYIARLAPTHRTLATNVRVGQRIPAYNSALGRMMLTDLPDEEIARRFGDLKFETVERHGPGSLDALLALIRRDREAPVLVNRSIYDTGIGSITAPVRDGTGQIRAAINVVGTHSEIQDPARTEELKSAVIDAALKISHSLGYRGTARP